MAYSIECDSCDFRHEFADEVTAYDVAKEHETEFTDHFVYMERPA